MLHMPEISVVGDDFSAGQLFFRNVGDIAFA